MNRKLIIVSLLVLIISNFFQVSAIGEDEEIEASRQVQIKKWGTDQIVQSNEVQKLATVLFARPLESQSLEELTSIAKDANRAANFIDFIVDELGNSP